MGSGGAGGGQGEGAEEKLSSHGPSQKGTKRAIMTKTQAKKLKEIDAQILQFGVYIQALVKDRVAIDRDSTLQFLDVFSDGLKKIATEKNAP
jgi:hypothetical protein